MLSTLHLVLATDLTVFHVNPASYPAAPINMDTGDALGDMYFDLRSLATPIECAHPTPQTARDCDNEEVVANDLVVTKLVLDVNLPFGECTLRPKKQLPRLPAQPAPIPLSAPRAWCPS